MTRPSLPARLIPLLIILFAMQGCFHSSSGGGGGGVTPTSPIFTSGDTINVAENTTTTGYTAVATDADGDKVTYSLTGGEDQAAFSINGDSGVLSFNAAMDFEMPADSDGSNTYVVEITATDGTNLVVQSLTVTVTDIDDDANPTGYYTNSGFVQVMMADDTTPRVTEADFQGMVTDSQFMMLSDTENLTYVGTFTVSGNNLSGTVTLYEAGVMTQEDVPLTGMVTAGSKITGTLGGTGAANGTFQLDYAMDNSTVTLGQVDRFLDWRTVVNQNIPNLNLADAADPAAEFNFRTGGSGGNIFGGCRYRGQMEPIAGTHLYTVSVTMDNCNGAGAGVDAIPAYIGLASVRGTSRFILALTNGAYDFSGEYFECLAPGCTP